MGWYIWAPRTGGSPKSVKAADNVDVTILVATIVTTSLKLFLSSKCCSFSGIPVGFAVVVAAVAFSPDFSGAIDVIMAFALAGVVSVVFAFNGIRECARKY